MVIVVAGQKGGPGKTMLAINLAAEAQRRDESVLLVDLDDPQRTLTRWHGVAKAAHKDDAQKLEAASHQAGRPLRLVEGHLPAPEPPPLRSELRDLTGFDLVVVDCPGRHDVQQAAAMAAADLVLLVCRPASADLWAQPESLRLLRRTQAQRPAQRPPLRGALVLNQCRDAGEIAEARQTLAQAKLPILDTEIHDRKAYRQAFTAGQGVVTYSPRWAGCEIRDLYDELLKLGGRA